MQLFLVRLSLLLTSLDDAKLAECTLAMHSFLQFLVRMQMESMNENDKLGKLSTFCQNIKESLEFRAALINIMADNMVRPIYI